MRISHSRWKTALLVICLLGLLAGCAPRPVHDQSAGSGTSSGQSGPSAPQQQPASGETGSQSDSKEAEGKADIPGEENPPADPQPARPDAAKPEQTGGTPQPRGTEAEPTKTSQPQQGAEAGTAEVPGTEGSTYDFSQPVPASPEVDNSYFADAAFIGDSRTDGFMIYSGIGCGKNLTSNGLSIFKLKEKKALTIDGKKYTLLEALALEQYGKVYLSLGVNELGYNNDKGFYQSYCDAIETIRQLQPNAVIYIQGLIPINEGVIAQTGGSRYLTNEHLRVYNDLMRKAAQEEGVVFLDLYSEFVDANGELPADASKDGVHLRGAWCRQWLAYLKTHTVDYETLYPSAGSAGGAGGQADIA